MVTKAKGKPPQSLYVWPGAIQIEDEHLIAECLSIDLGIDRKGLTKPLAAVNRAITLLNKRMASIADRPLPTHVAAALDPIAEHAAALVPHLDASTIQPRVLQALGLTHDEVHVLQSSLVILAENATVQARRYRGMRSAGLPLEMFSDALEDARIVFGGLFEQFRKTANDEDPKEREASKNEFIKICRRYLPPSPQQKKPKVR